MAASRMTRRSILRVLGGSALAISIAGLAAACSSQPGAPAAAPTAQSGAASSTSSSASSSSSSSAAPTAAPKAAASTSSSGAKPITFWYGKDYIDGTTDTLKQQMTDFTAKTNIPVNFVVKSGTWSDQLSAGVQAGTAPDIWQTNFYDAQYWNAQGQALELSQVINKYKGAQGGFFPYATNTISLAGKAFAIPLSTNTWPFQARQDILDKENGGKFPDTWALQQEIGKKITSAPKLYAYGWTMGKIDDANNHFIGTLWTYGGKLQNEDGTLGLKPNDEAALAVLELAQKMYNDDKMVPPAVVQWDNGANNNAYQGGQIVWTSNALSIYGWLLLNKPDLAKVTSFHSYPKGPSGSFGQVDVWCATAWKKTPQQDSVLQAMDWMLDPTHQAKRISDLAPRFTPVYQDLLNDKVWDKPLYAGIKDIAKNGRTMAYAAPPQAGFATFTSRYLIGEMMQNVIVKKTKPTDAYNQFYQDAKSAYDQY